MIATKEIICQKAAFYWQSAKKALKEIYKAHCAKISAQKERERQQKFRHNLEAARAEWEDALKMQNEYTDPLLIDFGAYAIKSAELKFRHLSNLARRENLSGKADNIS